MTNSTRRAVKGLLLGLGLYGPFWWLRGWLRGFQPSTLLANRRWRRLNGDSLPVPPPRLMYTVISEYEIEGFITSGQHTAAKIEGGITDAGMELARFTSVLDFGCGCGRVIRHFAEREHAKWHGCDYNPRLIQWCRDNLDFASFFVNDLAPPLEAEDGTFDLIYANSVFTHLDDDLQARWLAELRRVLADDGVLVATTHGDAWAEGLSLDERALYDGGRTVVRSQGSAGSNLCETYHPPGAFRALAEVHFKRVHHQPKGTSGVREQDVWVLEVAGG